MNFDQVELDHPDGVMRRLSPVEFRALKALDRVQWIGQGRFRFFLAGERIRPADALKIVRHTS